MSNSNSHFLWGINTYSTNFNDHSYFYFRSLNIFLSTLGGERGSTFHTHIPQIFCCQIWALQDFAALQTGSTKNCTATLEEQHCFSPAAQLNQQLDPGEKVLTFMQSSVDFNEIPQLCQLSPHHFNCRMRLPMQNVSSRCDPNGVLFGQSRAVVVRTFPFFPYLFLRHQYSDRNQGKQPGMFFWV